MRDPPTSVQVDTEDRDLYEGGSNFPLDVDVVVSLVVPEEGHGVIVALGAPLTQGDHDDEPVPVETHQLHLPYQLAGYTHCHHRGALDNRTLPSRPETKHSRTE